MIRKILGGISLRDIYLVISSHQDNQYNVFTAAGSPTDRVRVWLTVLNGIEVRSGITTSGAWRTGSQFRLINNGWIYGTGGEGVGGGTCLVFGDNSTGYSFYFHGPAGPPSAIYSNSDGGSALRINLPTIIDNTNGYIFGGGGGGGPGYATAGNAPGPTVGRPFGSGSPNFIDDWTILTENLGQYSPGGYVVSPSNPFYNFKSQPLGAGGGGGGGRGFNNANGGEGGTGHNSNVQGSDGQDGSETGPGSGGSGGGQGGVSGGFGGDGGDWGQDGGSGGVGSDDIAYFWGGNVYFWDTGHLAGGNGGKAVEKLNSVSLSFIGGYTNARVKGGVDN